MSVASAILSDAVSSAMRSSFISATMILPTSLITNVKMSRTKDDVPTKTTESFARKFDIRHDARMLALT